MLVKFALLPLIFCSFFGQLSAKEVWIDTQDGEMYVLEIEPEQSLSMLQETAYRLSHGKAAQLLIEMPSRLEGREIAWKSPSSSYSRGGYLGCPRNYWIDVALPEAEDIKYIVTCLANKREIALAFERGKLEAAGSRINHLHPLRFLMTIFTDEEMKVGIRNIRRKSLVWGDFAHGLKESLCTETNIGNMTEDILVHFAQEVKIDPVHLLPFLYDDEKRYNWDGFIDALIDKIPRQGNYDRYDCRVKRGRH